MLIEQFFRQAQPLNQLGSVGFRLPAVQFSEFRFQFRSQNAVLLGKILLGIEGIFLLHDVIQPLVAHNNGIQNGIGIIGEVILFEDTHAEIFRNGHFTGSRFQLTAENFQKCGFSGTVCTDNTVAVAGVELQVYIFEQRIAAELQTNIRNSNHNYHILSRAADKPPVIPY